MPAGSMTHIWCCRSAKLLQVSVSKADIHYEGVLRFE